MSLKITGIGTPFGSLSWELGETKREKAIAFLDFLTGQRILFNSCDIPCGNCQEYSSRSVMEIKEFVNSQLTKMSNENDYKKCLRQIRDICNNYLSEPLCQKLLIHVSDSDIKVLCPVAKYRKDIAYHMRIVTSMFNIEINNDLHRVFCINGL